MTDRELLELAAKAAGIALVTKPFHHNGKPGWALTADGYWNPLEDDGDALRLAVKLRMGLDTLGLHSNRVHAHAVGMLGVVEEPYSNDPYSATRRAIVRAAAALAGRVPLAIVAQG